MEIKDGISQIIQKRNAKVPALTKKKEDLEKILKQVQHINVIRDQMLDNSEKLKMSPEIRSAISSINTISFEHSMKKLIDFYDNTIGRFSRSEINIAVVGAERQGKSQLLKTISDLDDRVIPAFVHGACTGASSVIKNVPGSLSAQITFKNQIDMEKDVQDYLDEIYGGSKKLASFEKIGSYPVNDLEKEIPPGSPKTEQFKHLKKYIQHFNEWKDLVLKESITISDPNEIQKYVAQSNGELETSEKRENYYKYLAVKEAVISCPFNNPDTGSIVLRDTIGLGDTSLGISKKMLDTIRTYSDAAIIVRRPEAGSGKFGSIDESLYADLHKAFAKRNMSKWLFWLINRTTQGGIYADNSDRCEVFKKWLDENQWNIAQSYIVNVADKEEVNKEFLPSVLRTLIDNIDAIDEGIMVEMQELAETTYSDFKSIQTSIKNILIQGATEVVDTTDFLDNRWDDLYDSGLMKLLKEYRKELFDKKDEESIDFKNKVVDILKNSDKLLPSKEELLSQLQKGGKNRGIDVYTMRLDKLRTEFTREFLNIDEEIFDAQVAAFKKRIVDIFTSENGGKLGNLMSVNDYDSAAEWLIEFAEKYFVKSRYDQFKVAFVMLSEFTLTVRGFLMHRIRDRIDKLNPTGYDDQQISDETEAKKIYLNLNRKLNDVKEELLRKFEDELFREPNRVFYAIISEFYDRINFSYQSNMKEAEKTWEKFYSEHLIEIWNNEFQDDMKLSALYKDWSMLSDSLSNISKQDFTSYN